MNILILNWRDIKNPSSGGAEILTHELAVRFVRMGHIVTQISAEFQNSKREEIIDGVRIIRDGHPDARTIFNSVHFKAFLRYKKEFRGKVDLVIDEVHGVPFFTPLFVKEKKAVLLCEIAGDLWNIAVGFPFNLLGKVLEKIYPKFYKNISIITISNSSKGEIVKNGFEEKNVKVIPMGSNSKIIASLPQKEKNETLIFLSRISKTKGIEDAINATKELINKYPNIMLWILGRGDKEYVQSLKDSVIKLNLTRNVRFFDFVSEKEKEDLLTKAHILVAPSAKEGWGLTVHEAGARATPSVVYDVPGLRDIVKNGVNGLVCDKNDYKALAQNIDKLLSDKKLYEKLQKGAIREREMHTWEKTAEKFLEFAYE